MCDASIYISYEFTRHQKKSRADIQNSADPGTAENDLALLIEHCRKNSRYN